LKTILFIGHDAKRAGAQLILLHILQELKTRGIATHTLLAEGGPLEAQYRQASSLTILPVQSNVVFNSKIDRILSFFGVLSYFQSRAAIRQELQFITEIKNKNIGLIFGNTIAIGSAYRAVQFLNVPFVLFVHELAMSVKMYSRPEEMANLLSNTSHLITPSKAVSKYFLETFNFDANRNSTFKIVNIASMLAGIEKGLQVNVRQKLGLSPDAVLIGSCGNAEWRKGNDVFMAVAQNVINRYPNRPVYFIWVGIYNESELHYIQRSDAQKMRLSERIIHIDPTPDVFQYVSQLDVFGLFSREDPYPLVVLEAALAQKPIVCFEAAGGAPEFVETDCGFVVPYLDVVTMADKISYLIDNPTIINQLGQAAKQKVLTRHPTASNIDKALAIINRLILK
jgi:glycosyltransferase involved in cell wall biosynthesis